ncbi:hypothetical protein BDK51DRAFT_3260, partial [Blyttiomyces helicus]
ALNRSLQVAKEAVDRMQKERDGEAHAARMMALDREKFSIAREIKRADDEAEIRQMTEELEAIEAEERALEEQLPNHIMTKLAIYRSLGITVEKDPITHRPKAYTVRSSPRQQDIHRIEVTDRYSRFFYASYLWDM